MRRDDWLWIATRLGVVVFVLVLTIVFGALDYDDRRHLTYLLLLLALVGRGQIEEIRAQPWTALTHAAIWIGVLLFLVAIYEYVDRYTYSDVFVDR